MNNTRRFNSENDEEKGVRHKAVCILNVTDIYSVPSRRSKKLFSVKMQLSLKIL